MVHRKKLLVLALAAAAGAPVVAGAQEGSVQLYGKFYPEMIFGHINSGTGLGESVSTLTPSPTANASRNQYSLQASNSRFGIRGSESLGGGLRAIFQLENQVGVDAGGSSLASRDTFVGLQSEWGTVRLGNFDTVYKNIGDTLSFLGVSSGNFVSNSNVLSKSPLGTNSSASFHLRRANSALYETPELRGFGAMIEYSPDEAKTSTRNADLLSTGVTYTNGPLYAAIAYERHNDFFGGSRNARSTLSNFNDQNASSKDEAVRLTLRYEFGNTTVEGDYAHLQWKESGGAVGRFERYKHDTYLISVDHRIGSWRLAASYTYGSKGSCSLIGGANCSTDGLDGYQASLGASYSLSRRTQIFALAAWLNNGKSARLVNADWVDAVAPGQDIAQYALGVAHSF